VTKVLIVLKELLALASLSDTVNLCAICSHRCFIPQHKWETWHNLTKINQTAAFPAIIGLSVHRPSSAPVNNCGFYGNISGKVGPVKVDILVGNAAKVFGGKEVESFGGEVCRSSNETSTGYLVVYYIEKTYEFYGMKSYCLNCKKYPKTL
jgi:hypothetical protein